MGNIIRLSVGLIFFIIASDMIAKEVRFYNPSFDCSGVKKDSVEYLICTNKNIAELDRKLGVVYRILFHYPTFNNQIDKLQTQQKKWLLQRDKCKIQQCIESEYEAKIYSLQDLLLQTCNDDPKYWKGSRYDSCVFVKAMVRREEVEIYLSRSRNNANECFFKFVEDDCKVSQYEGASSYLHSQLCKISHYQYMIKHVWDRDIKRFVEKVNYDDPYVVIDRAKKEQQEFYRILTSNKIVKE